ncbi:MAG: sugar ABC transporter substrate-binding protein, partial [Gaiellaceae bacterium]
MIAVLCILGGALGVAAGSSAPGTHSSQSAGKASLTIGVDYPRSDTDFWNSYIHYTPIFAKQMGLKLVITNSENN